MARLPAFLAIFLGAVLGTANAQLSTSPPRVTVVEFHNTVLDHYFLTAKVEEVAVIDAGGAGPGWRRTGYGFTAFASVGSTCPDCKPVSRFYGTPGLGPNSHFFTASQEEADGLKRPGSGWTFEGLAFAVPVPIDGRCSTGTPVYRLFNNRWMMNDSNHRYVTSAQERTRMQALGWFDEGARFCALEVVDVALMTFAFEPTLEGNVLPGTECEEGPGRVGSCVAVNNLRLPSRRVPLLLFMGIIPRLFGEYTGAFSSDIYAPPESASGPVFYANQVRDDVFLQPGHGKKLGVHVDTRARGPSSYSSVKALYRFPTEVGTGAADERFFPFVANSQGATQLAIRFDARVKRVLLRGAGSHAYGHPTVAFMDTRSGRRLLLSNLAFGTIRQNDFVAPDALTGEVIVSASLRSAGRGALFTPSGFVSEEFEGSGGAFDFRIDAAEFGYLLSRARTLNPALSPDPADYLVDHFHFKNEIVGDGEIGMNLHDFSLQLLRR